MVPERLVRLVNHQAWIEHEPQTPGRARVYVKWGHYPETDGKLEPSVVNYLDVKVRGSRVPAVIGIDKDSSKRGALFLEFSAEDEGLYEVLLGYNRGTFTVTRDRSWIFGDYEEVKGLGYDVEYSVTVEGVAKAYVAVGEAKDIFAPSGLVFELTPIELECPRAKILPTLNGKPVEVEVTHAYEGGSSKVEGQEVELRPGLNLFSAKVDLGEPPHLRRIVTTLTLRC